MLPVLLRVGPVPVLTHDAFSLLGLLVALGIFAFDIRRRGSLRDPNLWWMVYGALLGGAIGAKASTAWQYVVGVNDPTLGGVLLDGGKSVVGASPGRISGRCSPSA